MFRFRLALALGMTVGELESRMSNRELHEWAEFSGLYPFMPERMDFVGGVVASTIANVHRGRGQKAFSPDDFIADYSRKSKIDDPELMGAAFAAFAAMHNAALENGVKHG